MSDYYDALETRTPVERETALLEAFRKQLEHARSRAPAYAELLQDVDPASLTELEQVARLPLTRKSDLIERQGRARPFGGLSAIEPGGLRYIFASPGPIYEPGTQRPDYWRMARAAFAAGFRRGDLVHSGFSYHLTPAGSMVDTAAHALGCAVIPLSLIHI